MGQSLGLAGTGASDHEKGPPITLGNPDVMLYRLALFSIEFAEMR